MQKHDARHISMKDYKKIIIKVFNITFLLTFLYTASNAQIKSEPTDFMADILIVKVKPAYVTYFKNQDDIDRLNKSIAPLKIVKITQQFPNSKAPIKKGQIDLSRIYTVKIAGIDKSALKGLANKLKSYPYFEYVEVKYIEKHQATMFVPNDPNAAINNNQRYLSRMQAYEGWAIEQGDTNVIIGIVDTGADIFHEDIKNNISYNYADPINGIDDDKDGYIDNHYGWDLADNDYNPEVVGAFHGAEVTGIAGATTNNGIGLAGVGFNSRILPIKTAPDSSDAITMGYEGIVYGAEHGCKVMNLSWGGTNSYSAYNQDVINYAALTWDVLILGAAGNTDEEADYYPAAYDNVLSVMAMDTIYSPSAGEYIETRANFTDWYCCFKATYAHSVDIGAQGMHVYSVDPGNKYMNGDGSSFATPIVAGAAAIVRAHFPQYTALQAAELLRVNADVMDTFPENALYKEKMGKGRVNLYKALTGTNSPAVRMINDTAFTKFGADLLTGDTVLLSCDFINYLGPTSALTINLSTTSPDIQVLNANYNAGAIGTLQQKMNNAAPFTFVILPSASSNEIVEFRLGYVDAATGYNDYQYFKISINPPYVTLSTDSIKTTITANGRFGFNDVNDTQGVGFITSGTNILYEGGLMAGYGSNNVSDCVRGYPAGNPDLDFEPIINPKFITNKNVYEDVNCSFNDSMNAYPLGIKFLQNSFTINTSAFEKTVFLEYKVINQSNMNWDSIYVGHFIDWDIQNYATNKADYDYTNRLGYAYNVGAGGLYAGITLLTKQDVNYYAMDNILVGGNNINPNAGFSESEKFTTLSSGIGRPQAGTQPTGNDISMVMGGRINHLNIGDTAVIAFALVSGNSLTDLQTSAANALAKFIQLNTGPKPNAQVQTLCYKDTATFVISPDPGKKFNFYDTIPAQNIAPVHTGNTYTLLDVSKPDTIYITDTDSLYESAYATYIISNAQAPIANFVVTPATANTTTYFFNTSNPYKTLQWFFGDGSQVSGITNPTHVYTSAGSFLAMLVVTDGGACSDTMKQLITVGINTGILNGTTQSNNIHVYPVPVQNTLHLDVETIDSNPIADVYIYNTLGQVVYQQNNIVIQHKDNIFDISQLSPGLYFIEVKTQTQDQTLRFIKE